MLSQRELDNAIRDFESAPANYENCKKLATFYTIFDHLYSEPKTEKRQEEVIGAYESFSSWPQIKKRPKSGALSTN